MAISPNAPVHGRIGCLMGQWNLRSEKMIADALFKVKADPCLAFRLNLA